MVPSDGVVTGTGAFDLHDVGAQVAERHRRERPRQHAGEVEDPDSCEGRRGEDSGPPVMWCVNPAMRDRVSAGSHWPWRASSGMIAVDERAEPRPRERVLAAAAQRTPTGEVMEITPAEIGRDLGFPDALSTARAVRALIARKRLEPAQGSYGVLDTRPVEPEEKESIGRRPRRPRQPRGTSAVLGESGAARYSDFGRAVVDRGRARPGGGRDAGRAQSCA